MHPTTHAQRAAMSKPSLTSMLLAGRMRWCHVRMRGVLRSTTLKVFYTESTTVADFVAALQEQGDVRSVDFPDQPGEILLAELHTAADEGRVVL